MKELKRLQTKNVKKEKPMTKRKKTPAFDKFERDGNTASYPPPTQIVKIPDGDKGYAIVNASFKDQTSYFKPGIKSVNKDLKEHDY